MKKTSVLFFCIKSTSPSFLPTVDGALSVEISDKFDNFSFDGIKRIQQSHSLVRPFIDSRAAISLCQFRG